MIIDKCYIVRMIYKLYLLVCCSLSLLLLLLLFVFVGHRFSPSHTPSFSSSQLSTRSRVHCSSSLHFILSTSKVFIHIQPLYLLIVLILIDSPRNYILFQSSAVPETSRFFSCVYRWISLLQVLGSRSLASSRCMIPEMGVIMVRDPSRRKVIPWY